MKNGLRKVLTVCLFVGMLGSSSSAFGGAVNSVGNYQFVLSSGEDDADESNSGALKSVVRAVEMAVLATLVTTGIGAGIDVNKNGGYEGSDTQKAVNMFRGLAKNTYFTPKGMIADKVLPKINDSESFVETKRYLSVKDNGEATFMGEVRGLGNVAKEVCSYVWKSIKGRQ